MQPRQQARLDDLDDDTSPPIELEQRSLPEYLLEKASAKSELVTLDKFTATTRIGIGLRHDMPERAVVYTVASGTPADGTIHPYDEILAIGGTPCESAIHAVSMIREAPAGPLEIEVVPCPAELEQASSRAGAALRAAAARRLGLSRRVINKPSLDTPLGLSFSPDYLVHSVIRAVKEGGLAATALKEGDCVERLNGVRCTTPADTARMLRESSGRLELLITMASRMDLESVRLVEEEARMEEEAALAAQEERRLRGDLAPKPANRVDAADENDDEDYDEGEEEYDSQEGEEGEYDEDEGEYEEEERPLPPREASVASLAPVPADDALRNRIEHYHQHVESSMAGTLAPTGGQPPRRLPASLSNLSPSQDRNTAGGHDFGMGHLAGQMAPTSTTRSGGPPLAKGAKPQGWREWLQQRRAMTGTNQIVIPRPPDVTPVNQRV